MFFRNFLNFILFYKITNYVEVHINIYFSLLGILIIIIILNDKLLNYYKIYNNSFFLSNVFKLKLEQI